MVSLAGMRMLDKSPLTLVVSPAGGTFLNTAVGTSVALTASRASRIFYTVDGTSPLSSATRVRYAVPFILRGPASVVLRSVAIDDANFASAENTNTFNFTQILPTVTAPVGRMVAGAAVTATRIPRTFSWTGSTIAGLSIAKYVLERSLNNGAFANIVLPALTATSVSSPVTPGGTYVYRVRATDDQAPAQTSLNGTAPSFQAILAQENAAVVKYQGSWARETNATYIGGAARACAVVGPRATYSAVNRSQLALVAQTGPNRGFANISIDGGPAIPVDLYSATRSGSKFVYVTTLMPRGTHTMVITARGTRNAASTGTSIDIDAVSSF